MNEKIKGKVKKLMTQAWEFVDHDLETVERDHVVTYLEHLEMVHAKFAELLIQQCIDIAFSRGDKVDYLKEHFGVEL